MSSFGFVLDAPFPALFARSPEAGAPRAGTARPAAAGDPDVVWVRAAQGGDTEAFRRLVERYRAGVVDLCARIVRSREEAEEAAQDSFVRAWRALPEFRGDSRFSTWLYRIATRRSLDAVRSLRKRRDREEAADPGSLERAAASPAGLGGPEQRRLWRILGDLDPRLRAAVSLFYLDGNGIAEVAAALELPEGTVKTHLHRARGTLRRAWARESAREERLGLPRL